MSDSYQAIYDAVRSRISNADIGAAVQGALQYFGFEHQAFLAGQAIQMAAAEHARPSAVYRPRVFPDQSLWCALYGENLQEGVCGFGDTPDQACLDFDRNWSGQKLMVQS